MSYLFLVFPLAIAEVRYLRRVGAKIDKQVIVARIVESEIMDPGMLELHLSLFEPSEDIDLSAFLSREQQEPPAALVVLPLIALDVFWKLDIGSNEHRFLTLTKIEDERIVGCALP
jgi:hypothetical protein